MNNNIFDEQEQSRLYKESINMVKQKRKVIRHFFVLLLAMAFLFVINKILLIQSEYNWWIWAILIWCFLFLIQFVNVFIINVFWGKEWERKQKNKILQRIQNQQNKEEENKKSAEKFEKNHRTMEDLNSGHHSGSTENN